MMLHAERAQGVNVCTAGALAGAVVSCCYVTMRTVSALWRCARHDVC